MKRTAMKPRTQPLRAGDKPLRRTGLTRTRVTPPKNTGLARTTPLRPVSKKRAAQNAERRSMLAAKYPERPLCVVPWCTRFADDAHEPLTRARGGSITDPANVEAVCRPHHDEITFEEPEWAYEIGLLKHSWGSEAA